MNIMPQNLDKRPADAAISAIAEATSETCLATRVRQLSRIVTRVYDDALRPLGITGSQYTLLAQLASRDGITAVEIGHDLDIEKSTLSRNLKRLLALGHIIMDPPAGRRGRGLHLTPKGQAVRERELRCLKAQAWIGYSPFFMVEKVFRERAVMRRVKRRHFQHPGFVSLAEAGG